MYKLEFQTADPLNAVPRALDTARKMGFDLAHLSVDHQQHGLASVSLIVRVGLDQRSDTLTARIAEMSTVHNIRSGVLDSTRLSVAE
jgi:acetolactate synthase regulatory subunit